jgi:hypothetical protein
MSVSEPLKRATFTPQIGKQPQPIPVHFNPVSLQYTIANTMKEGKGKQKKQYVSQTTAKLTMDLVFDTTQSGEDVRTHTAQIARFMEPQESTKVPPVVEFQWGTYRFKGMVESFKETIDFFAASGVPLRSAINLTMAQQDTVFAADAPKKTDEPLVVDLAQGDDATSTASRGLSPEAGRELAAANGQENMRFPSAGSLTVGGSVALGPPAAFASGGAGVSAGGGLSLGLSAGSAASAGIPAVAGAFAGLRAALRPAAPLSLDRLTPPAAIGGVAADAGATFDLGGRAGIQGSSSMTAEVGASKCLRSRIQFEEG